MHLPRKSDALDLVRSYAGIFQRRGHGFAGCLPPVLWPLLSPTDLRRSKRFMFTGGRPNHYAIAVHNYSTSTARSDVNSQYVARIASSAELSLLHLLTCFAHDSHEFTRGFNNLFRIV